MDRMMSLRISKIEEEALLALRRIFPKASVADIIRSSILSLHSAVEELQATEAGTYVRVIARYLAIKEDN